ncbi:pilus assembly FimT family protein [Aquariibacter albus]|uniref:Type II secretion system protein H n=1 Tax=Aquariibacter albus TaxID=2759899 RepID=A0A839HU99_9BURK|nr:GspH/FimT family pseudopilin [Aquariibacter albus]MBB1163061.1 GspH/FimT family pseudopilin [Aquariibacter albus]
MLRRSRRLRGLTLIELAITLAIFGMTMLTVLPNAADWLRSTQVRHAGHTLQRALERARSEALRLNAPVRFTLVRGDDPRRLDASCVAAADGGGWVISRDAPDGACGAAPSTQAGPRLILAEAAGAGHDRVRVAGEDASGAAASSLRFNGFGRVEDEDGLRRIALTLDGTRSLRLDISRHGAVRLCEPAVRDADDPRVCR